MSNKGKHTIRLLKSLLVTSVCLIAFAVIANVTKDAGAASTVGSRVYLRTSTRVYHHWLLTTAGFDQIECHIYTVDHNPPGHEDVLGFCGPETYQLWLTSSLCEVEGTSRGTCKGLTLHDIEEIDQRLKTTIWLPAAEVYYEFLECEPWGICNGPPGLKVSGYEPLRNQRIESVHVEYGNFTGLVCWRTTECLVSLPETNQQGMNVNVFVRSSFGDASETDLFRLRLLRLPDGQYQFEVLGTEWDYLAPPESIAWGIFPELNDDLYPWLFRSQNAADLATRHDYSLLAGRYILRGDINVSSCTFGGLSANGGATQCGMEQARELVIETQNSYDGLILEAANRTGVPPRILKGIIAQESQFWPDWYFNGEYGLGMLTDEGMEMMLTWNLPAFLELCIPEFGAVDCAWGYDSLGTYPQDYLRGLALSAVGTDQEIYRIAQTLIGAAAQSGQLVRNVTRLEPYQALSYQDMWKLTMAVYNSGAGCLYYAMDDAWDDFGRLTWGGISERLIGDCQNAADYPNDVLFNGVP